MPRIDPIQLLNCLSILLSPSGGIKSRDEVQRLASLMTKFSKKLVSKCIYIQILKCTETELLGLFMGSGGWSLVHTWLTESVVAKNSPLIKELLELLLLCPVDIERLKTNNCPKLVKELSRDGNNLAIRALASKLVEQWLKTVKSEQVIPVSLFDISQIVSGAQLEINSDGSLKSEINVDHKNFDGKLNDSENGISVDEKNENVEEVNNSDAEKEAHLKKEENSKESETLPVLKISLKDGKQIVSQVEESETKSLDRSTDAEKSSEKHRNKSKEKSSVKSSSDSKYRSSKHSSKSQSSSDKHKISKSSSSSRHSSKDKNRDKDKNYKSKSDSSKKSNDKSSSSSSRSKDDRRLKSVDKDKKDKEDKSDREDKNDKTKEKPIDKPQVPSIQKLGKIPKLSDLKKDKLSISIEVRKPDEPKPKTVKTFHSKFRKHGLEEEVKPPPSRAALLSKKPPPVLPPTVAIPKRPSPVHNEPPPEKKPKTIETIEKPGAIKLIPPKPKRSWSSLSLLLVSASVLNNSLGFYIFCGKSKMYK